MKKIKRFVVGMGVVLIGWTLTKILKMYGDK